MECNSFWKFDKSYGLRNSSKQRVFNEVMNNCDNSVLQNKSTKECIINYNNKVSKSLKDDVSLLLKTLANSKKNKANNSDASSHTLVNLQSLAKFENEKSLDMAITMRQVETFEIINN